MKSNYKRIGDFINLVSIKNIDGKYEELLGINIDKFFMPSVANIVGTDLTRYKIVNHHQFACNRMHVGRDYRIPIALSKSDEPFIVSPAYTVFEIEDISIVDPEYLMMWFSRVEFDREAWFHTDADVRGGLPWDLFCDIELPVPSIEKQRAIVKEYNTVVDRIELNERLNLKLEETAQAIYKEWFVDFEFPNEEGEPYKSSGGKMVWNDELEKEVPEGWETRKLSDLGHFTSEREKLSNLSTLTYLSSESMLPNRGGIQESNNLPNAISTTSFNAGDILISNIRPYFKKIWFATFPGGCSNDILCIKSKENINPTYLYFVLEPDSFFDYVMKGAKGTKMPRGDKDWIMNYTVAIPNKSIMNKFSNTVSSFLNHQRIARKEVGFLKDLESLVLSKMSELKIKNTIKLNCYE